MRLLLATASVAGLLMMVGPTTTFAADATPTQNQTASAAEQQQLAATVRDLQDRLDRDELTIRQMGGSVAAPAAAGTPFCRSNGYDPAKGECN
jgi:hypothetical protein